MVEEDCDVLELHEPQMKVFGTRCPIVLQMAGQRGGKSHLIGVKSGLFVLNCPEIRGMICANTYLQLTQSTLVAVKKVWARDYGLTEYDRKGNPEGDYVVHMKPPDHFYKYEKFDNYRGIISFINGGRIYIASLDNYLAHDGKEIGWAELDETKDTKEEAVKAVILARLSQPGLYYHKETLEILYAEDLDEYIEELDYPDSKDNYVPYNPCCINTSPAVGVMKWLIDMFDLETYQKDIYENITDPYKYYFHEKGQQAVCIYSTHWNSHNLPENYIDIRLSQLSEGEGLKYVFGYPFGRSGKNFYRSFSREKHIQELNYDPSLPIHITLDFNVVPYMTLIASQVLINDRDRLYEIRFIKEYCLSSPHNSTEAVCQAFKRDYEIFKPSIFYYGDATGDNRQPGSGDITQFDTVRKVLKKFINNSSDRVPKKNKNVLNRRDFVDRILEFKFKIKFKGLEYTVVILIDPSCKKLIEDMIWLKESVNGKLKKLVKDEETGAKYEELGHTSDALEYLVCEMLDAYYD